MSRPDDAKLPPIPPNGYRAAVLNRKRTMTSAALAQADTSTRSTPLGIVLAVLAITTLAIQDVLTKVLVHEVAIAQMLAVRFLVFSLFALLFAAFNGGIIEAARTERPLLHVARSAILIVDMVLFCWGLRLLGLAEFHAIYATAPLIATLLAGPLLGEEVGWRRRLAVAAGLAGALVIIRPGFGVFGVGAIIALTTALCWAGYNLMTRVTSRTDSLATSTLYVALTGAAMLTPFGIIEWQPLDGRNALFVAAVSMTGILGHMLFIKALEHAPASVLQPFNYLLLVWAAIFGFAIFAEIPDALTILGALIIVASGLYVAWRERVRSVKRPVRARKRR